MILCFDDEVEFARALGAAAGLPVQRIARHRFPDGELKLTLPPKLRPEVSILRSLHAPNEKLVELILAAGAARELGARELTLVAPYLAYMRQDSAFTPGEVVSQRHIGAAAGGLVRRRGHRRPAPAPRRDARRGAARARAGGAVGGAADRRLRRRAACRDALLLGPDDESAQWVRVAARSAVAWTMACATSSATATPTSTSRCRRCRVAGRARRAGRRRRQHRPHAGGGGAPAPGRRGGTGRRGGDARAVRRRRAGAGAGRRRAPCLEHRHRAPPQQRAALAPLLAEALRLLL